MLIIAENRKLNTREVLSHPLGPLPWSLATADGSLRKTNKASLRNELIKNIASATTVPQPSARIIDGMVFVQKIKGDQKTFGDVAQVLLSMILNEGYESQRIDVVFDVFKDESIKNAEREKRDAGITHEFKNIKPDHKIRQWQKCLNSSTNKTQLIKFFSDEWRKEKYKEQLAERSKTIFVTTDDRCFEISSSKSIEREDRMSTQEEADTRLLFHAANAAMAGFTSVVITSEDTDVFVLCLAFSSSIKSQLYVRCGKQTRTMYINVSTLSQMLGSQVCQSLLGLHSFTGCDTVSSFAGKGKISALKILKKSKLAQDTFLQLGTQWNLSDELFVDLQRFVCTLYCSTSGTSNINELRYHLFCVKKGKIDSQQLPHCEDCLKLHCKRANYQAAVWKRSLHGCPNIP